MNSKITPYDTMEPQTIFLTPGLQSILLKVNWVIQKRQGLACVFGEPGTGKTTLLKHVFSRYVTDDRTVATYIECGNKRRFFAFLTEITYKYRIHPRRSAAKLFAEFEVRLRDICKENKNSILFLDDAHLLQKEELALLGQMFALRKAGHHLHGLPQRHLMQIVLTAKTGNKLRSRLAAANLEIATSVVLNSLSPPEVKSLLEHCRKPLPPSIEEIYRTTDGNPGRVLELADKIAA